MDPPGHSEPFDLLLVGAGIQPADGEDIDTGIIQRGDGAQERAESLALQLIREEEDDAIRAGVSKFLPGGLAVRRARGKVELGFRVAVGQDVHVPGRDIVERLEVRADILRVGEQFRVFAAAEHEALEGEDHGVERIASLLEPRQGSADAAAGLQPCAMDAGHPQDAAGGTLDTEDADGVRGGIHRGERAAAVKGIPEQSGGGEGAGGTDTMANDG